MLLKNSASFRGVVPRRGGGDSTEIKFAIELSERAAEMRQDPQSNEINAYQRLPSCNNPCPPDCLNVELLSGKEPQPTPKMYVTESDVERTHQAEEHRSSEN